MYVSMYCKCDPHGSMTLFGFDYSWKRGVINMWKSVSFWTRKSSGDTLSTWTRHNYWVTTALIVQIKRTNDRKCIILSLQTKTRILLKSDLNMRHVHISFIVFTISTKLIRKWWKYPLPDSDAIVTLSYFLTNIIKHSLKVVICHQETTKPSQDELII